MMVATWVQSFERALFAPLSWLQGGTFSSLNLVQLLRGIFLFRSDTYVVRVRIHHRTPSRPLTLPLHPPKRKTQSPPACVCWVAVYEVAYFKFVKRAHRF